MRRAGALGGQDQVDFAPLERPQQIHRRAAVERDAPGQAWSKLLRTGGMYGPTTSCGTPRRTSPVKSGAVISAQTSSLRASRRRALTMSRSPLGVRRNPRRSRSNNCEISNMLAECAAVEADLAVVPLLASTVPETLTILGAGDGLPPLPMFQINLYLPQVGASDIAVELARHIRAQFAARYRRAA